MSSYKHREMAVSVGWIAPYWCEVDDWETHARNLGGKAITEAVI